MLSMPFRFGERIHQRVNFGLTGKPFTCSLRRVTLKAIRATASTGFSTLSRDAIARPFAVVGFVEPLIRLPQVPD
jgi:hypothetical protein